MSDILSLVLATGNAGKLSELRALLVGLPVQVLSQPEALGTQLTIEETGDTFADNAALKARAVCRATGLPALADDSGLEVDALGGHPGVRSARFAHERASDAENNAALLQALSGVPEPRSARFRCVLAFVSPWHETPQFFEGTCEGSIALTPRGSGGFGYDPLFVPLSGDGRALAQHSAEEKHALSHRGHAMRAFREAFAEWLNERLLESEAVLARSVR